MPFHFVHDIKPELFHSTRGAWDSQLERSPEDTSVAYYEAGLDYCQRTIKGETLTHDGGGCLCAVVEDDSTYASALLIVSHARAKNDLRMLEVYVQPDLNLAGAAPNYAELAWIAATAIIGCLGLTYWKFPSRQLKLHTAFPLDKSFMTAVTTAIFSDSKFSENYDVASQGNWLVVTKKNGSDGTHVKSV